MYGAGGGRWTVRLGGVSYIYCDTLPSMVQYSTVLYSTLQYSTVYRRPYSTFMIYTTLDKNGHNCIMIYTTLDKNGHNCINKLRNKVVSKIYNELCCKRHSN